ncbi:MAG: hypothetical protein ABJC89_03435 [Acidobacteriota bacterium]
MSFFDKLKSGIDMAVEGVSDFAETTKLKLEVSKLNDRKTALFAEIGKQAYALRAQGRGLSEIEAQAKEVDTLEQEIKRVSDEIAKIGASPGSTPAVVTVEPSTAPAADATPTTESSAPKTL